MDQQMLRVRAMELTLQWLAQDSCEAEDTDALLPIVDAIYQYLDSGKMPEKTEDGE